MTRTERHLPQSRVICYAKICNKYRLSNLGVSYDQAVRWRWCYLTVMLWDQRRLSDYRLNKDKGVYMEYIYMEMIADVTSLLQ